MSYNPAITLVNAANRAVGRSNGKSGFSMGDAMNMGQTMAPTAVTSSYEFRKKQALDALKKNAYTTDAQLNEIEMEFPDLAPYVATNREYNLNERPASATETAAIEAQNTKENDLLKSITARQMSLLQQEMNKQRAQGIGGLRTNLAQRGLMDSGSLQGGIGRINRDIGERTAQGALMAANQEGGNMLNLIAQKRQEDLANRQMQMQNIWNMRDQTMQRNWQNGQRDWQAKQDQRNREAQIWGGLAGAAGNLAGGWAGSKLWGGK